MRATCVAVLSHHHVWRSSGSDEGPSVPKTCCLTSSDIFLRAVCPTSTPNSLHHPPLHHVAAWYLPL